MNYAANAATHVLKTAGGLSVPRRGPEGQERFLPHVGTVYIDEAGVMLLDAVGRDIPVHCRYAAPLAPGKDPFHPNQFS